MIQGAIEAISGAHVASHTQTPSITAAALALPRRPARQASPAGGELDRMVGAHAATAPHTSGGGPRAVEPNAARADGGSTLERQGGLRVGDASPRA